MRQRDKEDEPWSMQLREIMRALSRYTEMMSSFPRILIYHAALVLKGSRNY